MLLASINDPTTKLMAQLVERSLQRMGFDVRTRYVTIETFFTKFCGTPGDARSTRASGGTWFRDFPDGQTMLDPTFNGRAIQRTFNTNVPQLDVPAINAAMSRAEAFTDPRARAGAWAAVDRQVTAQAPAILGTWNNQPIVHSKDVAAVPNRGIALARTWRPRRCGSSDPPSLSTPCWPGPAVRQHEPAIPAWAPACAIVRRVRRRRSRRRAVAGPR